MEQLITRAASFPQNPGTKPYLVWVGNRYVQLWPHVNPSLKNKPSFFFPALNKAYSYLLSTFRCVLPLNPRGFPQRDSKFPLDYSAAFIITQLLPPGHSSTSWLLHDMSSCSEHAINHSLPRYHLISSGAG